MTITPTRIWNDYISWDKGRENSIQTYYLREDDGSFFLIGQPGEAIHLDEYSHFFLKEKYGNGPIIGRISFGEIITVGDEPFSPPPVNGKGMALVDRQMKGYINCGERSVLDVASSTVTEKDVYVRRDGSFTTDDSELSVVCPAEEFHYPVRNMTADMVLQDDHVVVVEGKISGWRLERNGVTLTGKLLFKTRDISGKMLHWCAHFVNGIHQKVEEIVFTDREAFFVQIGEPVSIIVDLVLTMADGREKRTRVSSSLIA